MGQPNFVCFIFPIEFTFLTKNMDLAKMSVASVWMDRAKFEEAELQFHAYNAGTAAAGDAAPAAAAPVVEETSSSSSVVVQLISDARKKILNSMNSIKNPSKSSGGNVNDLVSKLQTENSALKQQVADLTSKFAALDARLASIEGKMGAPAAATPAPVKQEAVPEPEEEDDDSDDDLFGSDDEEDTAEQERIKAERIAAYNERKAGKKKVTAKSSILLDVKPWDDETDMAEVEKNVRSVGCDGLLWGASKLVPIGYGIKKLQINCVIEDDKVSTDFLEESICAFEDHVQSVDIAAFNKI